VAATANPSRSTGAFGDGFIAGERAVTGGALATASGATGGPGRVINRPDVDGYRVGRATKPAAGVAADIALGHMAMVGLTDRCVTLPLAVRTLDLSRVWPRGAA
jgi:hypothetical protein